MAIIKVAEATGPALDWLVAKCEDLKLHRNALLDGQIREGWWVSGYYMDPNKWIPLSLLNFSTDWAQGGPIKERERISTAWYSGAWNASSDKTPCYFSAQSELVAAMRAHVYSKLGDTVEVPE